MGLDAILESNRGFVRGRTPVPLPAPETLDLAVVACYDPRLDDMLLPALGLSPGRVFLLRTGGALVQPGSASLRSLALAVFMFGVTDVVLVGHTSCRMATFDTSRFIDAFRKRSVAREAFGADDLRTWAGAIPDPRRGVQSSVANILAAPFMPRDLTVSGLVLDDTSGALDVVVRPGEAPPAAPAVASPTPEAAPAGAPPESPEVKPPPPPSGADVATDPLVAALASFLRVLESKAGMRDELRRLRGELDRQTSPLVKFGLLEGFIRRAAADSREVADAYTRLRQDVGKARRRWDPQEVVHYFLLLSRRP